MGVDKLMAVENDTYSSANKIIIHSRAYVSKYIVTSGVKAT